MFIKKSKEFDSLVLRDHNKQDKSFDDEVDRILGKSLKGGEVTEKEGVVLFKFAFKEGYIQKSQGISIEISFWQLKKYYPTCIFMLFLLLRYGLVLPKKR